MRVKGGVKTKRRHNKILKRVKGFRQARGRLYKVARESYLHAGQYSLGGRRKRIGQMRTLWIIRLNAALREKGLTYSKFVGLLSKREISLNRKMLSELAIHNPVIFAKLVEQVKA